MPDELSPLAPLLPIPNRTVKRRRADDSTDCPCESRSSSGTLHPQAPLARPGLFAARNGAAASAEIRISQRLTRCPLHADGTSGLASLSDDRIDARRKFRRAD